MGKVLGSCVAFAALVILGPELAFAAERGAFVPEGPPSAAANPAPAPLSDKTSFHGDHGPTLWDRTPRDVSFAGSTELGRLGIDLAYSVIGDTDARDPQTATRTLRTGVAVDLGDGAEPRGSLVFLPDRLFIDIDRQTTDGDGARREKGTGLGFMMRWLDQGGNTTLKVATTKLTDGLSRELTRRVQVTRLIHGDGWELSTRAGMFQTSTRDGTKGTSTLGYAFALDFDLWPDRRETLGIRTSTDLLGMGGGMTVDDVSSLLIYRIRF